MDSGSQSNENEYKDLIDRIDKYLDRDSNSEYGFETLLFYLRFLQELPPKLREELDSTFRQGMAKGYGYKLKITRLTDPDTCY